MKRNQRILLPRAGLLALWAVSLPRFAPQGAWLGSCRGWPQGRRRGLDIFLVQVNDSGIFQNRMHPMKRCVVTAMFAAILALTGCSRNVPPSALKIEQANIFDETPSLKTLNAQERKFAAAMLATEDKTGLFDGTLNAVEINGFRILYHEKGNEIRIAWNGKFITVAPESLVVHRGDNEIAALNDTGGTQWVHVTDRSISYSGKDVVYHDHGYDGVDLQYSETGASDPVFSITNQDCANARALPELPDVVCCQINDSEYRMFSYAHEAGWQDKGKPNLRSLQNCQNLFAARGGFTRP
ncbi:MAG: hypothetical protein LBP52_03410 [Burkholderiaceae bacterium]|nr:hypothetical protein [Burkholderiaceae bacterium]